MLTQPVVVIIILLLDVSFFNYNCEYIGNYTDSNEYKCVQVNHCHKVVNLEHIIVSVPNHITILEGEKSVHTDRYVLEPSAFPENRHAEE